MNQEIEKTIEAVVDEINEKFSKLEKKVTKLLKQRRELVDCLCLVKKELVKDNVLLYKVTRLIDSTLTKIAKGDMT